MAPWGQMQRQLMNLLARHPQARAMVQDGANKVKQSQFFKNMQSRGQAYYDKMVKDAASSSGGKQAGGKQAGGKGEPKFSYFNQMKRKLILEWHQRKGKIFAFVTANFIMIIMAFQFLPVVMEALSRGFMALVSPSPSKKQLANQPAETESGGDGEQLETTTKKQRNRRKRKGEEELDDEESIDMYRSRYMSESEKKAVAPPQRPGPFGSMSDRLDSRDAEPATQRQSAPTTFGFGGGTGVSNSSMFDDTASYSTTNTGNVQDRFNEMHVGVFQDKSSGNAMHVDFNTSFLVKMGDETEFTSSLERENLTGAKESHR